MDFIPKISPDTKTHDFPSYLGHKTSFVFYAFNYMIRACKFIIHPPIWPRFFTQSNTFNGFFIFCIPNHKK